MFPKLTSSTLLNFKISRKHFNYKDGLKIVVNVIVNKLFIFKNYPKRN